MPVARSSRIIALAVGALLLASPARAQITLTVAGRPGEEATATAALIARHLPRRLGAGATITVNGRTTATAVDILNGFAAEAAKDGEKLLLAPPRAAMLQALGAPDVAYDAGKLAWIGAISRSPLILATSWVTGFKSVEDGKRREMDLGAAGEDSVGAWYPLFINAILRTRFKVATTYRSGKEIDAAIDSGEIGGRLAAWSTIAFDAPKLLTEGKLNFLIQIGHERIPELGSAPRLEELATPAEKEFAAFVSADPGHGRALALPAGTPTTVVEKYRAAFAAMIADPAFIKDARDSRIEVSAVDGAAVEANIARELAASPSTIARARQALGAP